MLQISQGMDGDRSSDFRAVGKGRVKEWMSDKLEPRKTMFKVERDAGPPFRSLRHRGQGQAKRRLMGCGHGGGDEKTPSSSVVPAQTLSFTVACKAEFIG